MNCRENEVVERWRWRGAREVAKEGVEVTEVEVEVEVVMDLGEAVVEASSEEEEEEEEEVMDREEEVWIEMVHLQSKGRWRG